MIANPNKPNIFQWDSHEDKCIYCTETAGKPEINPLLLHLLSSSKVVLRSLLKPSHGAKAALRCVHGQAEQVAFNCNVTNICIKIQTFSQIPDSRQAQAAPLAVAQETAVPQALIQCWSVRVNRKCSRSLKPD